MRFNRWLLLGLLLACGVGVALMVLAWWPRPGVNKANFDRIEIGMTRAEVEAIFDGPPTLDLGKQCHWDSAAIIFGGDGCVVDTHWNDLAERTLLDKLLDHFPWRERKQHLPQPWPEGTVTLPDT